MSRSCLASPCCSTGNVVLVAARQYSAALWRYLALPESLHARRGIVAVFGFAVAVFGFDLISSRPAWYRCGIWLRPNLFTPSVVSLRYSASLYFSGVLQVVVAAPVHGGREIGLWREIIFDYDLMHFNTTGFVRSSSPYHPHGAPIFPVRQKK